MGTLALFALAGLLWRGRLRRCVAFAAYLALVGSQGLRLALTPQGTSWSAWLLLELAVRLLTLAVALELAARLFGSLPGAAHSARAAILLAVLGTLILLNVQLPVPDRPAFERADAAEIAAFNHAQAILPRLAYGSAWLFVMLLGVATAFGLPLDPLHRVVVVGFAAYLLLYAVTLATMPAVEVHADTVNAVHTLSFTALLALWSHAAWRREAAPAAAPDVVERLWPWR